MNIHLGSFSVFPPQVKTVVFLGTRDCDHLGELIRWAEHKGYAAYRIEKGADLQPRWFTGVEDVGIVLGADHLEALLKEVIARLRGFAVAHAQGMLEGVAR